VETERLLDHLDRRGHVEPSGLYDVLLRQEQEPSLAHGAEP